MSFLFYLIIYFFHFSSWHCENEMLKCGQENKNKWEYMKDRIFELRNLAMTNYKITQNNTMQCNAIEIYCVILLAICELWHHRKDTMTQKYSRDNQIKSDIIIMICVNVSKFLYISKNHEIQSKIITRCAKR